MSLRFTGLGSNQRDEDFERDERKFNPRETDPDNEFRGWPQMPEIKPLEPVMTKEELAKKLL